MPDSRTALSKPQIEALLVGVDHKIVRAATDWVTLEEGNSRLLACIPYV
jgi:hypothetical protein